MKGKVLVTLIMVSLPWLAMAQSDDDLYYVPKKEKKTETVTTQQTTTTTTAYSTAEPISTVVVRDVSGTVRDVDEYNRRYTARDNYFKVENDTLYIEEKPYGERGEWINGFDGSDSDYEYAMRIIRFRSPRYAIPLSSPLYWEIVYGGAAYPTWDWNVYDDGLYAYVFPTQTNPLWWDWRFNWGLFGPRWHHGLYYGWYSPWYYDWWYDWYYPWYGYWGYWGGFWGGYWGGYWGGLHFHNHLAWGAGWHNRGGLLSHNSHRGGHHGVTLHGDHGRGGLTGRTVNGMSRSNGRIGGRLVSSAQNNVNSVRRTGTSGTSSYTRSSRVGSGESSYDRPSSTRSSSSYRNSSAYQRNQNSGSTSSGSVRSNTVNSSRSGSYGSYSSGGRSSGFSSGGSRSSGSFGGGSRGGGGGGGARRR